MEYGSKRKSESSSGCGACKPHLHGSNNLKALDLESLQQLHFAKISYMVDELADDPIVCFRSAPYSKPACRQKHHTWFVQQSSSMHRARLVKVLR